MTLFEEPDSLNRAYTTMWYALIVLDMLNPGLWAWNDKLEPSLEMAAQFPTKENGLISEDGLTITIPLNEDAKWSDGEPVTADDFVFTYEMIVNPANTVMTTWPYADYLESVTAQDDQTLVLKFTRLGLVARGTMQNAEMASALGVSTSRTYMITFGLGAAVSGLAGGLLAPITGVLPTIGAIYIAKAFITVISGGAAILAGTASASALLGGVNGVFDFLAGPTIGEVALLLAAIVLLRLMPRGITGTIFRKSL